MSGSVEKDVGAGQQPEVLAGLEAAARHNGMKAPEQGLVANEETKPLPAQPEAKNAAATEILHGNAEADAEHEASKP